MQGKTLRFLRQTPPRPSRGQIMLFPRGVSVQKEAVIEEGAIKAVSRLNGKRRPRWTGRVTILSEVRSMHFRSTLPHSHSILSTHRNALIYKRKSFLLTVKIRPSARQIFSLMISKKKLYDTNFALLRHLSTTIGRFRAQRNLSTHRLPVRERPSRLAMT